MVAKFSACCPRASSTTSPAPGAIHWRRLPPISMLNSGPHESFDEAQMSAAQEDRLRGLIARGAPISMAYRALWTRQAVRALIARESGVWLTLSVVGRYVRAWGFTAQRPMRRATERRDEVVRAWLESTYPAIARTAKTQGCEIQWADETGLSNQANYGRSFAPRGQTPILRRPARRFSQSMISSLTNQGKLRFMIYEGALNTTIFLNFLRRLVREAARKLFVIVDNLPVHRARRVTAWVHDHADQIELVYLPPYAPEHNPDEFLNNDLKQAIARRRTPKDKAALKSGLTSYMHSLQRCPAKVRAFFQAPTVRYAA